MYPGDFGDGMRVMAEGVADVIKSGVAQSEVESLRLAQASERELRQGDYYGELSLCMRERNATSLRSRVVYTHPFL
jgi:hypothetical protein